SGVSQRRHAARIYDTVDAAVERCFHYRARAIDVGGVHRLWIRNPESIVGCDMKNRLTFSSRASQRGRIREIPLGDFDVEMLEIPAIIVRSRQNTDAVAGREQMPCDRGSDKSGGAGNQHPHTASKTDATLIIVRPASCIPRASLGNAA